MHYGDRSREAVDGMAADRLDRVSIAGQKWLAIAVDIVAWEVTCGEENLLSAECDRQIAKRPVLARVVIVGVGAILTAHLANVIDPRFDIVSPSFWARFR